MNAPVEATELRGQLVRRLGVAAGLVIFLLLTLAFFDYLASPSDDTDTPVFTQPVPVAPRKEVSQPVTNAQTVPEPPAPEPPAPAVAKTPADESAKVVKAEDRPAPPAPAALPPVRPVAPPVAPQEARLRPRPAPVAEATVDAMVPPRPVAPPAQLAPSAVPVRQVQTPPPVSAPALSRLFSGFLLQAGVFASPQRAEELHARLTLSGVPSTLETRVQVGPFKSRQEAEAAQEKLKSLGIETVLVPPKGRH